MTDTNIIDRTPSKFDYASPIQFRFKMTKLPNVEFFIQSANIPSITFPDFSSLISYTTLLSFISFSLMFEVLSYLNKNSI